MGFFSLFRSSKADAIEEIRRQEEAARRERINRRNLKNHNPLGESGSGPERAAHPGGSAAAGASPGRDSRLSDYYQSHSLARKQPSMSAADASANRLRVASGGSAPAASGDGDELLGRERPASARSVSDMQYRRFAAYIEEQSGIVLGSGKQYLVNSRLSTLLIQFDIDSIDDLITKAMDPDHNKEISVAVIDAMTTNETLWFRDTYPYMALKNIILPELAKKGKTPVRIWSAACSSGQEPYSIAMTVQEQAAQMIKVDPAQTQIVGTDLSPQMLERCRHGLYDSHALGRGLSTERREKFFKPTHDPNVMVIDNKIKSMVTFKQLNLLGSYSLLGKFDVIFCRNVLIYFSNEVKSQILNKFALNLNPGGYLILGSSESINGLTEKYDMIRFSPGIGYRLKPPAQ